MSFTRFPISQFLQDWTPYCRLKSDPQRAGNVQFDMNAFNNQLMNLGINRYTVLKKRPVGQMFQNFAYSDFNVDSVQYDGKENELLVIPYYEEEIFQVIIRTPGMRTETKICDSSSLVDDYVCLATRKKWETELAMMVALMI